MTVNKLVNKLKKNIHVHRHADKCLTLNTINPVHSYVFCCYNKTKTRAPYLKGRYIIAVTDRKISCTFTGVHAVCAPKMKTTRGSGQH